MEYISIRPINTFGCPSDDLSRLEQLEDIYMQLPLNSADNFLNNEIVDCLLGAYLAILNKKAHNKADAIVRKALYAEAALITTSCLLKGLEALNAHQSLIDQYRADLKYIMDLLFNDSNEFNIEAGKEMYKSLIRRSYNEPTSRIEAVEIVLHKIKKSIIKAACRDLDISLVLLDYN